MIQNQLAAKELFVAKYYISIQKWAPAISRLKVIVEKYDTTIFIEEALHRLVEVHYHIGLEDEANNYAKILGYNYNSSEWFEQSYKILNKDYKIKKIEKKRKQKYFRKNYSNYKITFYENKNNVLKIYKQKIKNLKKHNKYYFIDDDPKISDDEYDKIKKEIIIKKIINF